ncbi:MAG: hypothetical protein ABI949_15160 [Ilumatobacteraceae bacterium]
MRVVGILAVTAAALFAAPAVSAPTVVASCVGPTLKLKPARVARGAVLTINGQFFGDDCADTGTLPHEAGPLGTPLTGLSIVIDQGDHEFVVATGSAGADYSFKVDVVVPAALEAGDAVVNVLGVGDARLASDTPLVISTASPQTPVDAGVATFGPTTTTGPRPSITESPVPLPGEIPDEPAATTPPLSTAPAPVTDNSTTRDLQRAIGVGIAGIVAIGATAFAVWGRIRRRGW